MNYYVYKHIFPNGKAYIGITFREPKKRWAYGNGYHHNAYITNAIKKYGWENVKHEILFEVLTKEEAEQKEIELIAFYKTNQREYGYNIESGGNHNGKHSEETKKKISESNIGKVMPPVSKETREKLSKSLLGRKMSNEAKEKMRKYHLGRKQSEETKEKLKQINKGKKPPPTAWQKGNIPWNKGIKYNDEYKQKLSMCHKGQVVWNKGKKNIYSKETLEKMSIAHITNGGINVDGIIKSGKGWARYLNKYPAYINRMIKRCGIDYTINYIRTTMRLE